MFAKFSEENGLHYNGEQHPHIYNRMYQSFDE
jgi:hypothetical protein